MNSQGGSNFLMGSKDPMFTAFSNAGGVGGGDHFAVSSSSGGGVLPPTSSFAAGAPPFVPIDPMGLNNASPTKAPAGSRLSHYINEGNRNRTPTNLTTVTNGGGSPLRLMAGADYFQPHHHGQQQPPSMGSPGGGVMTMAPGMNAVASTSSAAFQAHFSQSMPQMTRAFADQRLSTAQQQQARPSQYQSGGGPPAMFPSYPPAREFRPGVPYQQMTPSAAATVPEEAIDGRSASRSPNSAAALFPGAQPDVVGPAVVQEVGGTTYFYSSGSGPAANGRSSAEAENQPQSQPSYQRSNAISMMPNFQGFAGPPAHLARWRPKGAGIASFFTPADIKMELLQRQLIAMQRPNPDAAPDLPPEVDHYHFLVPMEPPTTNNAFCGHPATLYKATNTKDGLVYCIRRLHNCRLLTTKCLTVVDMWKKLIHTNVCQLREVFTTKAFGDYSLIFVYDFHASAETLKYRHFSGQSKTHGMTQALFEELEGRKLPGALHQRNGIVPTQHSQSQTLPESLLWTYVIQLSSALRAIHNSGMAARTIDLSKILIVGKSKLMINCCGILDVLTFETTHTNMAGMIHSYQQDDLIRLGKVLLQLARNRLDACSEEHINQSMTFIQQNFSTDLRNLVTYLLLPSTGGSTQNGVSASSNGSRKTINDVMPMIGARFYAQLEAAQMRNDLLEVELAKEVQNGRLFRLLCKFGSINERPEYNMDASWSETGDRYLLKLFRDYLFHQITEGGKPWLDLAHVVQCLNKLDAGVPEKVTLMSRDGQNVLVVSYADLRHCLEQSFQELSHSAQMTGGTSAVRATPLQHPMEFHPHHHHHAMAAPQIMSHPPR